MSLLGTAAINQGHHIGLQQLETLAATMHAFLGPSKCYKFIQDEMSGEAAMVCSCYRLLEQLELSSSVGQLLHDTIRAHQKTLHSGTSSLVFLAGVWSRVALECLHKGISISHIIAGMSKGLELCEEACRNNVVTVEEIFCKGDLLKQPNGGDCMNAKTHLPTEPSLNTEGKESTRDTVRTRNAGSIKEELPPMYKLKLKHSRHFNSCSEEAERTQTVKTSYQKYSKDIVHLAEAVSHGSKASMDLVVEASRIQSRYGSQEDDKVLDVDRLVTCLLPGLSEEHSAVLHGYVTVMCDEQASLIKHFKERTLKVVIVNGDVSEKYCHVGFNRPKNVTYIGDCSTLTGVSKEVEWMDKALGILLKFSIDVLLVSGVVTGQLKDHCLSHNILVIERVRATILNEFAITTGAIPISYLTQLTEQCVGGGVRVNMVREYTDAGKTLWNVVANGTSLVTAVITSSVHGKLQSLEDQFWSCAYRLHHALSDGMLLPGGGAAEMLCVHQIFRHLDVSWFSTTRRTEAERATVSHEQEILRLMAESWMDYISTLMVNAGQVVAKAQAWTCIVQYLKDFGSRNPQRTEMPESPLNKYDATLKQEETENEGDMVAVYDNVTVKFETWKRALDLVFLILQTDTEIITGINEKDSRYRDFVVL